MHPGRQLDGLPVFRLHVSPGHRPATPERSDSRRISTRIPGPPGYGPRYNPLIRPARAALQLLPRDTPNDLAIMPRSMHLHRCHSI